MLRNSLLLSGELSKIMGIDEPVSLCEIVTGRDKIKIKENRTFSTFEVGVDGGLYFIDY